MKGRIALLLLVLLPAPGLTAVKMARYDARSNAAPPETVVATFHVKDGKDSEFVDIYRRAWSAYKHSGMVMDAPHLLMKGSEDGKPCFYEVLQWKSSDEPDNAPDQVKDVWRQMEAVCETRPGHKRGIEFAEVKVLAAEIPAPAGSPSLTNKDTETVFSTFRVKEGKEADFIKVEAKAWSIYRRLGMTLAEPHVLVRSVGEETGKPGFFGVLTWKDHDAPDHASEEVKAVWREMEALCEKRDGHRGIEFEEVQIVDQL